MRSSRAGGQRAGPRYPGVGIALWTSAHQRAGRFQRTFKGRKVGSAILSDLDAQVDYLVSELRRTYRPVLTTLMAPNVSAEQASDAVVLRVERPAAVLDRSVTDPLSKMSFSVGAATPRRRCECIGRPNESQDAQHLRDRRRG